MMNIVTRFFVAFALTIILFGRVAPADELPTAKPADVGFSAERLDRITQLLREDIGKGVIPGAVLLIARHGKIAYFESLGVLDPNTKAPMTKDAIFRVYSMSKPITSVAAMMLFEQGRIALDEPIAKYLPKFKEMKVGVEKIDPADSKRRLELVAAEKPITIQDLMRHTSGLTYGFFGDLLVKKIYLEAKVRAGDFTYSEFADRIAKLPLAFQPGSTWDYSHSTDILGRIIEVVSGKSLLQFEKDNLLGPVGMTDTSFVVSDQAKHARVSEPFNDDRVFGIDSEFNDPRLPRRWESGGGGMVATAMDYARFAQMLLNGGTYDGRRYLGPKTVAYMTSDHLGAGVVRGPYYLPGPGYGFGLGVAVRRETGVSPYAGSVGDYYWGGAGGTYYWADPKEDMFVVFMMQAPRERSHYRVVIRNMVYAALEKIAPRPPTD
jgi:CubicO group peptidase (beta-lactamase class C family)